MMALTIRSAILDSEQKWDETVKALLKAELKRRNVSYADLSSRLAILGVTESEPNIRNKIARGKFTAVFFFQCMEAIGVRTLRLKDD
ncbi:MAG: DUF6471 domain-containing protein [Sphingomonas pseudosanguinis]|uniref:DUF6471 domain-containing protein n=1 Tax=Sphingomonas pseudosanguinis TaxID=413712 RepID=UPI00391D7789